MATLDNTDKLNNLKSAVAALTQIRSSLFSPFQFSFHLFGHFHSRENRRARTILAIPNRNLIINIIINY